MQVVLRGPATIINDLLTKEIRGIRTLPHLSQGHQNPTAWNNVVQLRSAGLERTFCLEGQTCKVHPTDPSGRGKWSHELEEEQPRHRTGDLALLRSCHVLFPCAETCPWHLVTNVGTTPVSAMQPQLNTLKGCKDKQTSPCRWCHPYASICDGIPHIRLVYVSRSYSRQETDSSGGHRVREAQEASNSPHRKRRQLSFYFVSPRLWTHVRYTFKHPQKSKSKRKNQRYLQKVNDL